MSSLIFIAIRHLRQSRLRTALSTLAVALGAAMTVAANFVGRAFRNSLSQADDVQTILVGLLDQLDRMLLLVGLMVTGAAGFLVFNAFAMTITQRQKQIGALRSLGMTRRQVMGLLGGGIGLVAGVGFTLILATVFGGNAVGVRDLALWPTAWRAVQPALLTGLLGLMAAPLVCGAAAWLPVRALLRQSVVGSLQLD